MINILLSKADFESDKSTGEDRERKQRADSENSVVYMPDEKCRTLITSDLPNMLLCPFASKPSFTTLRHPSIISGHMPSLQLPKNFGVNR